MAHGECGDHPEAVSPVPALVDRGQGEQKQDVVERIGIDDVAKPRCTKLMNSAHHSVRFGSNESRTARA